MNDIRDPSGVARVLLIEDKAHAAMLIAEMLRAAWPEGLVLMHATRLEDATQELLDHAPSCVLLGLHDSDVASIEHGHTPAANVAIVALASELSESESVLAIRAGAQDVLSRADLN